MTTTPERLRELRGHVSATADAYRAFVNAREALNAARPEIDATPAERGLYEERYKADHAAEREHFSTALRLAQNSEDILSTIDAQSAEIEALKQWQKAACSSARNGEQMFAEERALRTAAEAEIEALKAEREEEKGWEGTLRYCEKQWQDERLVMMNRYTAAEARLVKAREALREIKSMTDADDPESYRCDDREGSLDTVFSIAATTLAEIGE